MEGRKKKRKVGGIILLCMSFLLVIVLTFTLTLAWFFDGDWSSNYVTMAGSVGIEIRDETSSPIKTTSGAGTLHFNISTDLAYPGQAIDASASVYNNGGISVTQNGKTGSECYIRARFVVYTNIGTPVTGEDGNADPNDNEADHVNAQILYKFLNNLVKTQNGLSVEDAPYYWQYYTRTGGCGLSTSGVGSDDILYYLEGASSSTKQTGDDLGYFYLCQKTAPNTTNGYLYSLPLQTSSVFLWNDQFIIPWQLTNYSADKHIFVAIEFQAIQTFIPEINSGIIASRPDNQAHDNTRAENSEDPYYVLYNNESVQTVFNSCVFPDVSTIIKIDGVDFDFGDYANQAVPPAGL